ncbi:MAG: hypothetical protein SGI77_06255 [Pirellulaceae bacterium]|nr:hypothetical protein [Pirellulaceae bacterium]
MTDYEQKHLGKTRLIHLDHICVRRLHQCPNNISNDEIIDTDVVSNGSSRARLIDGAKVIERRVVATDRNRYRASTYR